jgi:hypothetical protein
MKRRESIRTRTLSRMQVKTSDRPAIRGLDKIGKRPSKDRHTRHDSTTLAITSPVFYGPPVWQSEQERS